MNVQRLVAEKCNNLKKAEILSAEVEEGNAEYKFKLTDLTEDQFRHRVTQLNWRLNEGGDEAVYMIGIEDDGNPLGISFEELEESLSNLQRMSEEVGCSMTVVELRSGITPETLTAEILLKRTERIVLVPVHVHVAVGGDAGAGKTTLIAVLSSGIMDNGNGRSRMQVFRHNHEVASGNTSSLSIRMLFFNSDGHILNADLLDTGKGIGCASSSSGRSDFSDQSLTVDANTDINGSRFFSRSRRVRSRSDIELADETCRTVSLIDLAGSSKYLKTALHGIVGHSPEYLLVCVSAKAGILGGSMAAEHLGLAFALNLPLLVVVTKIDAVNSTTRSTVVSNLVKLLSRGANQGKGAGGEVDDRSCVNNTNSTATTTSASSSQSTKSYRRSCAVPIESHDQIRILLNCEGRGAYTETDFISDDKDNDIHSSNGSGSSSGGSSSGGGGGGGGGGRRSSRSESLSPSDDCTLVPIFQVSSVTGEGLDLLRSYLFQLPNHSKNWFAARQQYPEVRIIGSFTKTENTCGSATNDDTREEQLGSCSQKGSGIRCMNFESNIITATSVNDKPSPASVPVSCLGSSSEKASGKVSGIIKDFSDNFDNAVMVGQIVTGKIALGDELLLGPFGIEGTFSTVTVSSLRVNNVPVRCAIAGQCATMRLKLKVEDLTTHAFHNGNFATTDSDMRSSMTCQQSNLSGSTRSDLSATIYSPRRRGSSSGSGKEQIGTRRKATSQPSQHALRSGLALVSSVLCPRAYWEFEAEVLIINHRGVAMGYEPVVHIGCVRQSARIVNICRMTPTSPNEDVQTGRCQNRRDIILRTGERGLCTFRFLYFPEYLRLNAEQTDDPAGCSSDTRSESCNNQHPSEPSRSVGIPMVMREGRTRGVGQVVKVMCPASPGAYDTVSVASSVAVAEDDSNFCQPNVTEFLSDALCSAAQ